jgi:hypothetical protein
MNLLNENFIDPLFIKIGALDSQAKQTDLVALFH